MQGSAAHNYELLQYIPEYFQVFKKLTQHLQIRCIEI